MMSKVEPSNLWMWHDAALKKHELIWWDCPAEPSCQVEAAFRGLWQDLGLRLILQRTDVFSVGLARTWC